MDRGQAHTLEGVVAAIILLSSLLFALQVTTVTPLSASTSSQHIENQQREITVGILSAAAENGALKRAILYYNASGSKFHDSSPSGYPGPPPNEFGSMLNRSLSQHGIAYNVRLVYSSTSSDVVDLQTETLIDQGYASDNAVTVSRSVVLTDDDVLYDEDGNPTSTTISNETYFAEDAAPHSRVYNVVRVEVTLWRI